MLKPFSVLMKPLFRSSIKISCYVLIYGTWISSWICIKSIANITHICLHIAILQSTTEIVAQETTTINEENEVVQNEYDQVLYQL